MKTRVRFLFILLAGVLCVCAAFAGGEKEAGIPRIVIATAEGPMTWTVENYKQEFERANNCQIELITFPFGEYYQKMMTSFTLGSGAYDMVLFPVGYVGDFAGGGYLLSLDEYINNDADIQWNDIMPVYRERIASWGGETVCVPIDGDLHTTVVRIELMENAEHRRKFKEKYGYEIQLPDTWEQYYDLCEFAHNWDWDGDGKTEYGAGEAQNKGGQSYWIFLSRALSYTCIAGQPGTVFDPDTMKPLINNPGFVQALEDWKKLLNVSIPGTTNMDVTETREIYISGDVLGTIDWGDVPQLSASAPESRIKGQFATIINPGVTKVWNWKTNKWQDFPQVNKAPFLAFGGWAFGLTSTCKAPELAYKFISYVSTPERSLEAVLNPRSARQPYRKSHFANLEKWKEFGFSDPAEEYIDAVDETLAHPNVRADLRIPGTGRYYDALDVGIARALAGEISAKQALDEVAARWDEITNELGRESQLKYYRDSIGVQ
ncbi:extracellular solute-binding protein [bacterium]|nr:extracellular solute-binding protein [candidate division CSSED10-310 bacterium]